MILDDVKVYINDNLVDEDTTAVLLIGSWANGNYSDPFDIDLMVIKKAQLTEMYRQDIPTDTFQLDVYIYDQDALYSDLDGKQESLNHINNISLALLGLVTAQILYDKEGTVSSKIDIAKEWSWDSSSLSYLDIPVENSEDGWIKNAIDEDMKLLEIAKQRFADGQPITTRKKDYPSLLVDVDEAKAKLLMDQLNIAYTKLGVGIEWSELNDAKKSLACAEWKKAFASMKDVLRYMLRYELPSVPEQILDPNLWNSPSMHSISNELESALITAFS